MNKLFFPVLAALALSGAALAEKMVITAGGVTVKVDCAQIDTKGKTCTQVCKEMDKHPEIACRMEGNRLVITYGDTCLDTLGDFEPLALIAHPGEPVDVELEPQEGALSLWTDGPVDVMAYDLEGAEVGTWSGIEALELPAQGGLSLEITSWEGDAALELQLTP